MLGIEKYRCDVFVREFKCQGRDVRVMLEYEVNELLGILYNCNKDSKLIKQAIRDYDELMSKYLNVSDVNTNDLIWDMDRLFNVIPNHSIKTLGKEVCISKRHNGYDIIITDVSELVKLIFQN